MQKISSKDNEIIKNIRKVKDKKYRDESNEFVIEGVKLVAEAIQENSKIKYIVLCDDCERSDFISKELMYEIAKYVFMLLKNYLNIFLKFRLLKVC